MVHVTYELILTVSFGCLVQDLVAFLPGELEQNKHKNPFYVKPCGNTGGSVATTKRKRPRLSAPRKAAEPLAAA